MNISTSLRSGRIDSSEIRKVFDLASKLKNPVNLSIGQPDFPVPEAVKEAMIKAIRDNKNSYTPTQGILPLREKIAEVWKKDGINVEADHVLVSAGVASILYLLYDVLFNEGDEILIVEPYFLIYESLAQFHNLKKTYLSENFTSEDIENLKNQKGFKPKAVIFSTPSNPTGKILSKEQLSMLSDLADHLDMAIISDEIYRAFDYDKKHFSIASINPQRTITLGGFSKSHAMTGLRVGYVGVNQAMKPVLEKMTALQQYSIVCSPSVAQWAAITALENPLVSEIELMRKRRDKTVEMLKGKVDFSYPDGAFYVFPSIPVDSKSFIMKAIEKELLIVPGYIFTKNQNSIRISYAQEDNILEKGLGIFLDLVGEVSKG